jgi:hypothetical protein
VTVTFSSPQLGVPQTRVPAIPRGGDDYRVAGIYTPIVGPWKVAVATTSGLATAFELGVTATQPEPGKPPPPLVQASTRRWGIGELLAVAIALGGAVLTSRRRTRLRALTLEASGAG